METKQDQTEIGEWTLKSKLAIDLIANKWRLTIIHALSPGTLRYSQLRHNLGRISHTVLAQALRSLERDGLVERRTYPQVPPRVEYSLTPLGQSLLEQLRLLCHWAEEHESEIGAAQARFDERERSWAYSTETDDANNFSL